MAIAIEQLAELLRGGKQDQARALLASYATQDLSDEEIGELYTWYLELKLDIINQTNGEYEAYLDDMLVTLRLLEEKKRSLEKGSTADKLRQDLKNL